MLCFPVLKASSCRALTMTYFASFDYKRQLRSLSQGKTQTPRKIGPVKAQIPDVKDPMGNQIRSRLSKDKPPTASSSHHGSSADRELKTSDRELKTSDRELKTSERNSPVVRRSSSQQPEHLQHYSENYKFPSEKSISMSKYDNSTRVAHDRSDRTTYSSTSDVTSQGNPKCSGTVFNSSGSRYGSSAGAGSATASPDANHLKIKQPDLSRLRGSSNAQTALIHNSVTTFNGPSDSSSWSNGRQSRTTDRSGDTRIRSASQGLRNLGNTQPKKGQDSLGNYPEYYYYSEKSANGSEYDNATRLQRSDHTTSSLTSDTTSRENPKSRGTIIDSLLSRYETGAGAGAAASPDANSLKAKTGQRDYQSRGSSDAQIASIHTSAITSSGPSESNNSSNGRRSRATDRSDTTRIRSASQGLRNLGNTCYMNSILQCLAKVPWFKDGRECHLKFKDDMLNAFFSLMKKMQENDSDDSSLDPYQFRQQISSLGFRFSSSEQNDAHEFLLCLLSRLSKTLKSERKTDLVGDFLLGRQQNVIRFKDCGHVLINDQPFFSLSLPLTLESGKSMFKGARVELHQCLENYTRTEDVDGDALCMDCQRMQLCSIEASFKCPPKILIIHLKRYDFTRAEKLENEVRFPLDELRIRQKNLNASGKVEGYEDIVYDLIAVCNHYGSLRFGHYTADIKSPSSNHWYNYSDSRVTHVSMPSASREVCILFYRQSHS